MPLIGLILFALFFTLNILSADYRENTFLFCLKLDQEPLIIIRKAGAFNSGITELDNFLNSNPISDIKPWLTNTFPKEHSGNIYLNRIYRVYLTESKAIIRDQLIDEIMSLFSS